MSEESVGVGTEEAVEIEDRSISTESKPSTQDGFAREAERISDALGIVDGQAILTLIE